MDLSGRIAVVTGGGRGIGAGIARGLAKAGARVAVCGRNEETLQALAREIGGLAVRCDVASPDDVAQLAARVHAELGPPAIVVNNAGIAASAKFADTDEETWQRTIEVNLGGSYRVTRAFLGDVVASGPRGRVLFIASTAARVGFYYTSAYCASKHGVLGLARSLAMEIATKGPTVNCVCPGWVDTDMADEAIDRIVRTTGRSPADARAELARMNPQKRLMTVDEVAAVALFLISDAASAVTGQAYNVDGGQVMS